MGSYNITLAKKCFLLAAANQNTLLGNAYLTKTLDVYKAERETAEIGAKVIAGREDNRYITAEEANSQIRQINSHISLLETVCRQKVYIL